jgi:viologen exporter family transport system permease protein
MRLATVIARGQLDYYLVLPKNVLLHVLISRMGVAAWGDVSFGVLAFLAAGHLGVGRVLLYLLLVGTGCGIFVAYHVVVGSLAFWAGSAENLAGQASGALTNFSLYPGGIFRGWVKLLLFTAIPAGLMGHVPAEQIRNPDPRVIAAVAAFSCAALFFAWWLFAIGLRRYQSGNLVELRG